MPYKCVVVSGAGVASKNSARWFNAWAKSEGLSLYPGTLNLQCCSSIKFNSKGIPLKKWDGISENPVKDCMDYDPKMYPAVLKGEYVWVFRWGGRLDSGFLFEIVAEECLRDKFSLKDGDEVEVEVW